MNDKDKKMLESALWHISNSVTNGKSQTAECEITQWLRSKINPRPAEEPSEELEDAARNIRDALYLKEGKRDEYGNPYFLQGSIQTAVSAGANWQKEQMMKSAIEVKINRDTLYNLKPIIHEKYLDLKIGDKILIIKEDEQ